ncbi:MAG: GxxExxY protein [Prevotella sp.]|nr:GxxExxY protein [Prevotella sp.]
MINNKDFDYLNELSGAIIGAAIEVHKEIGPGLLESAYEECLKVELMSRGMQVETQVDLPLYYKGKPTGKTYRIDMLVNDEVILELKSVELLKNVNEIQLVTYLKLANKKLGLLINFNEAVLKDGIRRKINSDIVNVGSSHTD